MEKQKPILCPAKCPLCVTECDHYFGSRGLRGHLMDAHNGIGGHAVALTHLVLTEAKADG